MHVKKDKRSQLGSHTQKCVFIGYPSDYKGWLFWSPELKKEVISNSAEFDERFFPGNSTNPIDWPLPPLQEPVQLDAQRMPDQGGVDDDDDLPFPSHFKPKKEEDSDNDLPPLPPSPSQQSSSPSPPRTPPEPRTPEMQTSSIPVLPPQRPPTQ